jgi:restriction endonuclease
MFELHKQYGWSKFIVVVPSIAIREGVYKSLNMMADHFQEQYGKKHVSLSMIPKHYTIWKALARMVD